MRKFISKIGIIFLMAFVIGIGYGVSAKAADDDGVVGTTNLNNTAENSAKVGDSLKQPEKGWKRYQDTDINFTYDGDWTLQNRIAYSGGTRHECNSEGKIRFNFTGSKLNLIFSSYNVYGNTCVISIDGNTPIPFNTVDKNDNQILVYTTNSLENKEHYVVISWTTHPVEFDAIDIDESGKLLPYNYATLTATADNKNQSITLNWDRVNGAKEYIIKKSTTQGSRYETIASNIKETTYIDENVEAAKTYYYIVTPIINGKEGTPSNEASVKIEKSTEPSKPDTKPEVKGDAVLTITMTNGNIKKYNVSMKVVNKFVEWYEDRASGNNGNPYYKFDKTRNEDEPKTEYIVFDKISSFQIEQNN